MATPPTLEQLRGLRLFAELDDAALGELSGLSRVEYLPRKRTLYSEGEAYRGIFVVLDGLAVVYKMSNEGRMLILQVCRPGDSLGEVPLFEEGEAGYPAHAKTTRDSHILLLPHDRFIPFLKTRPEVAWPMLQGLAARIKEMSLRLEGVTLREVSSRLAHYLLREMEAGDVADDEKPVLTLPLTKGSIASYLGTVHETLSRTLSRLIRNKIIAVDGPRITVLDKDKLKRLL